mmetsp:Transcript_38873/g.77122  ORF Transcript_38873/g.77122 Transcript_38873/m.77122 type:complete len:405 (-) Transcript_38873:76-1290(-)
MTVEAVAVATETGPRPLDLVPAERQIEGHVRLQLARLEGAERQPVVGDVVACVVSSLTCAIDALVDRALAPGGSCAQSLEDAVARCCNRGKEVSDLSLASRYSEERWREVESDVSALTSLSEGLRKARAALVEAVDFKHAQDMERLATEFSSLREQLCTQMQELWAWAQESNTNLCGMRDGLQVVNGRLDSCEKLAKSTRSSAAALSSQGSEDFPTLNLEIQAKVGGHSPAKILRTCSSTVRFPEEAESRFYLQPLSEGNVEPHSKHRERGSSRPSTPSAVELHGRRKERSSGASRPSTPGGSDLHTKLRERSASAIRSCTPGSLASSCPTLQRGFEPTAVDGLSPLSSRDCTPPPPPLPKKLSSCSSLRPISASGRRSRRSSSGAPNTHGSCHKLHRVMHTVK